MPLLHSYLEHGAPGSRYATFSPKFHNDGVLHTMNCTQVKESGMWYAGGYSESGGSYALSYVLSPHGASRVCYWIDWTRTSTHLAVQRDPSKKCEGHKGWP